MKLISFSTSFLLLFVFFSKKDFPLFGFWPQEQFLCFDAAKLHPLPNFTKKKHLLIAKIVLLVDVCQSLCANTQYFPPNPTVYRT